MLKVKVKIEEIYEYGDKIGTEWDESIKLNRTEWLHHLIRTCTSSVFDINRLCNVCIFWINSNVAGSDPKKYNE